MSEKAFAVPDFPWQIVVASDLKPGVSVNDIFDVDKHSFTELFEKLAPQLSLSVENTLGVGGARLEVDLTFTSLKDFTPDLLVQRVPVLNALLEVKKTLVSYHSGKVDKAALQPFVANELIPYPIRSLLSDIAKKSDSQMPMAPPAQTTQPEEQGSVLDSILDMTVETKTETPKEDRGDSLEKPVDGLIQGVTHGLSTDVSTTDVAKITETIDTVIGSQVDAVLHDKDFVTLESAWRELKFLIDNTNFRAGIKVQVIVCAKEALCESLATHLFRPAWNEGVMAPDVVVSCHALGQGPAAIDIVQNLAAFGQSTQTPIIAWAGPSFFGCEDFGELEEKVPSLRAALTGTGYERWRSIRETSEASWLVLATNSFALRNRYGKEGLKTKSFSYEETKENSAAPQGSASLCVATLLSKELALLGTDEILSRRGKTSMDVLSFFTVTRKGETFLSATAVPFTSDQIADCVDAGLMPITAQADDPSFYLASNTVYGSEATTLSSMAMVGHVARLLIAIAQNYSDRSIDDLKQLMGAVLKKILVGKTTGIDAESCLTIEITEDQEATKNFSITADMPFALLGSDVGVTVSFSL